MHDDPEQTNELRRQVAEHDQDLTQRASSEPPSGRIGGGLVIVVIGGLIAGGIIATSWVRNLFHIMGAQPSAADRAAFEHSQLWAAGVVGTAVVLAMLSAFANRSSSGDEQ